jgi:hypothetical protein
MTMSISAVRRSTAMILLALCLAVIPAAQHLLNSNSAGFQTEILDAGGGWPGNCC